MFISATAPTIANGFGLGSTVNAPNGVVAFRLNIGGGGTANSGPIGLPNAANGWNYTAQDITTTANAWQTKQTANTHTSVTFTNYNMGIPTPWQSNDTLAINCLAY